MKECGLMENSMEKVNIFLQMEALKYLKFFFLIFQIGLWEDGKRI